VLMQRGNDYLYALLIVLACPAQSFITQPCVLRGCFCGAKAVHALGAYAVAGGHWREWWGLASQLCLPKSMSIVQMMQKGRPFGVGQRQCYNVLSRSCSERKQYSITSCSV
jgi:hypothetical protein